MPTFAELARSSGARVHETTPASAPELVRRIAREAGLADVRAAPSAAERFPAVAREFPAPPAGGPDARYLSVAASRMVVADTGSVLLADPAGGSSPDLAEVCVCLVDVSSIVGTLDDTLRFLGEEAAAKRLPADPVLVTGPSRTGDIEHVLTVGVHGPKALHLLLVSDA
ncbi:MAG: LUD domain-containing protein [Planctomycetes bacterium]|nr:LUD domain-containing protein [Planctomycetota bacterium]